MLNPKPERQDRDPDHKRPALVDYVLILGVIGTVTIVALIVLGGQVSRVLSVTSGGV